MDSLIENIAKIANQPKVMKHLEPQIIEPYKIETWMVKRVLYSLLLLMEEEEKK